MSELTNEEWWNLFVNDYPQLQKIMDMDYRNGKRACYKCFTNHSIAEGHIDEIPSYWIAL